MEIDGIYNTCSMNEIGGINGDEEFFNNKEGFYKELKAAHGRADRSLPSCLIYNTNIRTAKFRKTLEVLGFKKVHSYTNRLNNKKVDTYMLNITPSIYNRTTKI